jgi:hypothetical protein
MELKFKLIAVVISLSLTACGEGSSSKERSDSSSSTNISEESNDESGSTDNSENTLLAPTISTTHHSEIHTIEAINISKIVPAGSFNTMQYKFEDSSSIVTMWMDITTATSVAFETKDTSGGITSSSELISFTREYYGILKKLA